MSLPALPAEHEYAGWRYNIDNGPKGWLVATLLPGQHSAGNKEKHRRAAVETFLEENKS